MSQHAAYSPSHWVPTLAIVISLGIGALMVLLVPLLLMGIITMAQ